MEDGEAHTLGLLKEFRRLAREAADSNAEIANQFHELLRSISGNNTPDVANGLQFKVLTCNAKTQEVERTISLCGNITVARAAFDSARAIFPESRWMLLWGAYVVEDTDTKRR